MIVFRIWKRGIFASFLFFVVFISDLAFAGEVIANQTLIDKAHRKKLYLNPVWRSLLHSSNNKTYIEDHVFILSGNNFSLKREMDLTIELLFSGDRYSRCKFPARYYWLSHQLGMGEPNFDACAGLMTFLRNAPLQNMSIVFASENISQPSSMMGHVFLKISGVNTKGRPVNYAISYFTDVNTINFPKLIFESLITGKKGYYTLSPYEGKLSRYMDDEQRNVWEFELNIESEKKKLVQLHLYELKDVQLPYFFHNYNCATLINYILSIINPEVLQVSGFWISPVDVVKSARNAGLIRDTKVFPSNRWKIRMISEEISFADASKVKQAVLDSNYTYFSHMNKNDFLKISLATAYLDYRHDLNEVDEDKWRVDSQEYRKILDKEYPYSKIDISSYKLPYLTPSDSQYGLGFVKINDVNYLSADILPASHTLFDDNSQYVSENELKLADLAVLVGDNANDILIDHFQLYSAASFIPYDSFTGGLSGRFGVGAERRCVDWGDCHLNYSIGGGAGRTYRYYNDVDFYGLIGANFSRFDDDFYVDGGPDIGILIREVFRMKSVFRFERNLNYLGTGGASNEWSFSQIKYFNNDISLGFHRKIVFLHNVKVEDISSFGFKKYF